MNVVRKLNIIQTVILLLLTATVSSVFIEDVHADESIEVLKLVNNERTIRGISPLVWDKDLGSAAMVRAKEITITFNHTRPDGSRGLNILSKAKGENIAAGQKTAQKVVNSWMNSPGHRKNMLNPDFKFIGVGHQKIDTNYKDYWVQLFGYSENKKIYLEKVSGIKVEGKKKQITLKWNKQKPSKATGYEVFSYDFKTKSYQLLKKIAKHSTNKFVVKGLGSSTTYKYKIRSYKVVNNKNYYTPFSAIATRLKS